MNFVMIGKKFFRIVLPVLFTVCLLGCGTVKVLVGDVRVYDREGEQSYYYDAIIHNENVREGEVLSSLDFRTQNDVEYRIEGKDIVVSNLRWEDGYRSRHTTYYYVPYYYGDGRYIYYRRPPRMIPAPRPVPRVQPQPAPHPHGGNLNTQPPHGGRRR